MRAGQTLTDRSGTQVSLFPLEYMNISQGEGGSYSHSGTQSIDFMGWGANGRITRCPYYAPFDCHVVQHASYYNIWQSDNPVITPNGKQYVAFVVMHDDTPPSLGTSKRQGEVIGHTGTATSPGGTPVTGDHVHINACNGKFLYWVDNGHQLKNHDHIYNLFYINDTVIINDYNYNWQEYSGGIVGKKHHFKWILYAEKLRNRGIYIN